MVYTARAKFIEKAFGNLGPKNRLVKLCAADRLSLYAVLTIYNRDSDQKEISLQAENGRNAAVAAVRLARMLDEMVKSKGSASMFAPYFEEYRLLPTVLRKLSAELEGVINPLGKRGLQGFQARNCYLVIASHFVLTRIGKYCDEDLADLMAQFDYCAGDDVSGDSIRKRRDSLRKSAPVLYEEAVQFAEEIIEKNLRKTSSL